MTTPKKSRNLTTEMTPKRTGSLDRPTIGDFSAYLGGIHGEFKRGSIRFDSDDLNRHLDGLVKLE